MNVQHIQLISGELQISNSQTEAVAKLIAEGATVPFISRYRKEATGSLDEVAVMAIRDRLEQLADLDKRREAILKSLTERELLTPELKSKITAAANLMTLEDIYLPYRPKRRTRATIAREKGLEALAKMLLEEATLPGNQATGFDPAEKAAAFINEEKEVATVEDALAGARAFLKSINTGYK